MPLTKIDTIGIQDDAITADQIADGTVIAADILDNTITGGKLATDIVISTSGNITTTGNFTSLGIDDNATANVIVISDSAITPSSDSAIDLGTNLVRYANVYADTLYGDGSNLTGIGDASAISDDDGDTKIQTEESADEDILRFDTSGTERATMDSNGLFFTTNGGFVAHNSTITNDMTLSSENMMLVGAVTISGTLTVGANSTVVVL